MRNNQKAKSLKDRKNKKQEEGGQKALQHRQHMGSKTGKH